MNDEEMRDLDKRMAAIMGYPPEVMQSGVPVIICTLDENREREERQAWEERHPTEKIDQAMQVLVWLVERYGSCSITADMEEWGPEHPVCVYVHEPKIRVLWKPMPLAICLAARQATEGAE